MHNKTALLDYYQLHKLIENYNNRIFFNVCNTHEIRCNLGIFCLYFLLRIYVIYLPVRYCLYSVMRKKLIRYDLDGRIRQLSSVILSGSN